MGRMKVHAAGVNLKTIANLRIVFVVLQSAGFATRCVNLVTCSRKALVNSNASIVGRVLGLCAKCATHIKLGLTKMNIDVVGLATQNGFAALATRRRKIGTLNSAPLV